MTKFERIFENIQLQNLEVRIIICAQSGENKNEKKMEHD